MRLTTLSLAAAAALALSLYPAQQAKALSDCSNFEMYAAWSEFKADMCNAVLGESMCNDENYQAANARYWRDNVCNGRPPGGGLPSPYPG